MKPDTLETLTYIPQNHLEVVCNDLRGGPGSQFERELKAVIFSHVPAADRLGHSTLDDLLAFRVREHQDAVRALGTTLHHKNTEVALIEAAMAPEYRRKLIAELQRVQDELNSHRNNKPTAVPEPATDPAAKEQITQISSDIERTSGLVASLDKELDQVRRDSAQAERRAVVADKLLLKIQNIERQWEEFKTEATPLLAELGVDFASLAEIRLQRAPLQSLRDEARAQKGACSEKLSENEVGSPARQRQDAELELVRLRGLLDAPHRAYQGYLAGVKTWAERERQLIGDADTDGSIKFFEAQIAELDAMPSRLVTLRDDQMGIARQILAEKDKLAGIYRELYGPVQEFISTHGLAKDRFNLVFEVDVVADRFADRLLGLLNQGRRGSFIGVDEGRESLERLVTTADFQTAMGVEAFIQTILDHLTTDRRLGEGSAVAIVDQLRKDVTAIDLYDYLLGLDYLKPRYVLRWDGKDLEQLSPGERGTLLLIFYLLIDSNDTPLVIDQPEGNLDNETVTAVLVDCIREARKRRQVIIVTHNPNLAVVCDADQIVCAKIDRSDGHHVTYKSGSLENPEICQRVIEVLEGNRPAFDLRDYKYKVGTYLRDVAGMEVEAAT